MNLGRRKTGSEHISHIKKFLNQANDPLKRLKALRTGLDKLPPIEAKQILTEHSAPAFHVFYTSFAILELGIREKLVKGKAVMDLLKEFKDAVLPFLERVIILLPELIQQQWQYNSICLVIRKLLHPENSIELRQWGIRLVVLWLQALQDHAGDASIELFASAIPNFPPNKTPQGLPMEAATPPNPSSNSSLTLCERYGRYSSSNISSGATSKDWATTRVIYPIYNVNSPTSDPTLSLMEYLLVCLTTQACRLKWNDPSNHSKAFAFLFFQFKLFYLVCLYKNFRSDAGLYSQLPPPVIKLPNSTSPQKQPTPVTATNDLEKERKMPTPSTSKHVTSVSTIIKLDYDTSAPVYQTIRHLILKFVLKWIMPGFHSNRPGSIQPKLASPSPALLIENQDFMPDAVDIMREMWFASRDNINLLFEICHQAFLLPLLHPGVVNKLTELYSSWVLDSNKPLFMQPPPQSIGNTASLTVLSDNTPASSLSVMTWEAISNYVKFDKSDVRAGVQPSLKMFIAHTSQLFLHVTKPGTLLENLVESGRRILKLYQDIVLQWILDGEGWLYLLKVLLHLTIKLLYEGLPPPSNRASTVGGSLADVLLQTLLVSYIRASMVMTIPDKYWDNLCIVLSTLTHWKEVITQWTEIMRKMTYCLASVVYHVDLDKLPLDQLLVEDSHRSRTKTLGSPEGWKKKKSFSDIKPKFIDPRSFNSMSNTASSTSMIRIPKAATMEETSTTKKESPGKRRQSSPATPNAHKPLMQSSSTVPILKRDVAILEDNVDEDNKDDDDDSTDNEMFLNAIPSETHLATDSVISNSHVSSPEVRTNDTPSVVINNELSSPKSELVISNDDVSTASSCRDESPSVKHRSLTRSLSENIFNNPMARSNSTDDVHHSLTPEPTMASNFTHYLPHQLMPAPARPSPTISDEADVNPDTSSSPKPPSIVVSEGEGRWSPGNVSLVWQRMLCILSDINKIENPSNHALALKCITEIWNKLNQIESNLGISMDSKATPSLPQFMPPMHLFLSWTVKACALSHEFQDGRKLAYRLLCDMTLRHVTCSAVPSELLPHFYRLMHCGLQPISDVIYVAIRSGCRLLNYGLPGSSILLYDSLVACSHLLSSKNSETPKLEALTLLGSMYYLLRQYSHATLPIPVSGGDTVDGDKLKERLVVTLFNTATNDSQRSSRCLALYQVGMFVYTELSSGLPSESILKGIDIMLATLKFPDSTLVKSSIDMLTLISEQSDNLLSHYSCYIAKVLKGLSSAGAFLLTSEDIDLKAQTIVTLLLCLRDWVMSLPINNLINNGQLTTPIISDIFKVLHAASKIENECVDISDIDSSVGIELGSLESSPLRSNRRQDAMSSTSIELTDIAIIACSVLSHLMNYFAHFPLMGGAAGLSSTVCEFHDSPSLEYLDELSSDMFDSPRVQFLALNGNSILSVIEIPLELAGLPSTTVTASYQCRMIIRDITGKYCWDASILYGSKDPLATEYTGTTTPLSLIKDSESIESLMYVIEDPDLIQPDYVANDDPLSPPSWKTTLSNESDLLHSLLVHQETTSPECVLYQGITLVEPAPAINEPTSAIETILQTILEQQHHQEHSYQLDTDSLLCMQCEPAKEPEQYPTTFAFHYCRLLLSHIGFLSWQKRHSVQLLNKDDQLIRELKHLDSTQTQCRQTYKVAVLYVACGQEDKLSILSNTQASRAFEEFVAGLGWEVDMSTHGGYMGGLSTKYSAGCTMPYYATSSEEILFHVSTRMPSSGDDIDQKVRHLGNDEVHIIWSEHWRDYRSYIIKTQFADILIIIYPLANGLYRIQIDKKSNVQFGPLFNGAVIDGDNLSALVRATALNALRAQRSPLCMYRGRYQDRWRYIKSVMNKSIKSCYEDFAQSIIHPLQTNHITETRHSPSKPYAPSSSGGGGGGGAISTHHSSSLPPYSYSPETRWTQSQHKSHTQTDGFHITPIAELHNSVPENLNFHDMSINTSYNN